MIADAAPMLLEAVLRALAAAVVLWGCMRLLHVENVPAQKAAWGLVLAAALAMPLLMRVPVLPAWAAIHVPAPAWQRTAATPTVTSVAAEPAPGHNAALRDEATRLYARSDQAGRNRTRQDEATPAESGAEDLDRFSVPSISDARYDAEPRSAAAVSAAPAPAVGVNRQTAKLTPHRLVAYGWLAYLCVTATLLLRLLLGLASSLRLWMRAEPVAVQPEIVAGVAVRASRCIASPVNIGSGIVLPADYAAWDTDKLRVVLAHEQSHVRQRDFYLQLAAGLYASITWFSPLGWWLKRKLSELGEAISDRAGMEAAASPSAYAQLLLEFAALPRPAYTGVAMAHSSNLSERIERLLNDSSFRRAFTGSHRALLVLAPAVLFATTALVRVQAAQRNTQPVAVLKAAVILPQQAAVQSSDQAATPATDQAPVSSPAPVTGQSHPDQAQVSDEAPAAPPAPAAPQAAPLPAPGADAEPAPAPVPPVPPAPSVDMVVPVPPMPAVHVEVPADVWVNDSHHMVFDFGGDSYVLVGDPGTDPRHFGFWRDDSSHADIDKARSMAHGHFLLFRHEGKTYFIDDPDTVARIEAMQKPMDDLRNQMRALSKQAREQGQQERDAAREAERKAREAQMNIPAPDLTKQMAELDAAVAELKAQQGGTVTREQLNEIQRKLGEVQRQLMSAEIKVNVNFDRDFFAKFGAEQGKYGQQMGELGQQMGKVAHENDEKMKLIVDESLKNGKAKPVN